MGIKGINIQDEEEKIRLYADDVLVYLSNPEHTIPRLWSSLKAFGKLSGYSLNINKTQIMIFNFSPSQALKKKYNLKWDSQAIEYLGVTIPRDITLIYERNYVPINKTIKADLNRWSLLSETKRGKVPTMPARLLYCCPIKKCILLV